jgi:uncharacterized protein YbjT (DUF2867 family)
MATPAPKTARHAVLAGATGLVGSALLARLLADAGIARVHALTRRPLPPHDKLSACPADFDALDRALASVPPGAETDVYCALGTTIRTAGSQAAFRRVDHDYVLALARWAVAAHARRFLVVSALGADANSRNFYNRVKGETEAGLKALPLRSLVIAQPSLLAGERTEWRLGERLALAATRLLRAFIPAAVRPVNADDVAAALVQAAQQDSPPAALASAAMQGAGRSDR